MAWMPLVFGGVTLFLGYLVAFKGMVDILAVYKPEKVKDPKAYAKFVGGHLLLMGAVGVFIGLIGFVFPEIVDTLNLTFFVSLALIAVRIVIGGKKYQC